MTAQPSHTATNASEAVSQEELLPPEACKPTFTRRPGGAGYPRKYGPCRVCLCERLLPCRGLCSTCYGRYSKYGKEALDRVAPIAPRPKRPLGTRLLDKEGYVVVQTENGLRAEHRVVMERMLGRTLVRGESVHHKNGIRHDNRSQNLELWYRQPAGQRIEDLIAYLTAHHTNRLIQALSDLRAEK